MTIVYAFLVVGFGAASGAWLRWGLGLWLNAIWPNFPLGTLCANLFGGYLVGVAVAFLMAHPELPAEWRLFVITGFLGGLTTFSTFSSEAVSLLLRAEYGWALSVISAHLFGSLLMTFCGIYTVRLLNH